MDRTLKQLTPESTLEQLISTDRQAANLLASIGMNPGLNRDRTLRSVCRDLQWNEEEVLQWVKKEIRRQECEAEPEEAGSLEGISRELQQAMQPCLFDLIVEIENGLPRVHQIHGTQYPELKVVDWVFGELREALKQYLVFEKELFFPLVLEFSNLKESMLYGNVRKLGRSISILKEDQNTIRENMRRLEKKTGRFSPPEGSCSTLRILYRNLEALSVQLERYFSIENRQLFPKITSQIES